MTVETPLAKLHLVNLLRERTSELNGECALRHQVDGQWQDISWQQMGDLCDSLSRALLSFGVNVQDKVGIFSQNCAEWILADVATMQLRSVVVPIYPTSSLEQAAYICNDATISVLFIGDQPQYDLALAMAEQCSSLRHLILINPELDPVSTEHLAVHRWHDLIEQGSVDQKQELNKRLAELQLDDLATLIYTSGTTGEPKGVMLDHRNIASSIRQHQTFLPFGRGDVSLAFLPLSHVFERAWSLYVLTQGGTNALLAEPMQVQQALVDIRPNVMCAVPRLNEKIYSAVIDKLERAPRHKRALFHWALSYGQRHFEAEQGERPLSAFAKVQYRLADKLVLSKIRTKLGGRIRFMPVGGAALDPKVNLFFQSVGIRILAGYGMTETTASVTATRLNNIQIGTNGEALPEVDVKIGANDEVLVRGETVMRGYYNRPDANAETFTEDGWLRTGDCGYVDDNGCLRITDRIKELMKTSNGKYVAPQRVEGMVARDPLIEQIAVVADARNYVSALIVPAFEALETWAKEKGILYQDQLELVQNGTVKAHFEERLKAVQTELAKFEQVKQFTLLPREFCMKLGELTPTMKLRRKVIYQRFAEDIEAMYDKVRG